MRKFLRLLCFVLLIALAGAGGWFFMVYCEGEEPEILPNRDIRMIGRETTFDVTCSDNKSGVRSASVTLSQDGRRHTVGSLDLPGRGVNTKDMTISVSPEALGLHDGAATIDMSVTDYSLRKNRRIVTLEVVIDTAPPRISPASFQHYINPGGSCVVTYRLSEEVLRSGVQVDNDYFPSYPGGTEGGTLRISYFALPAVETPRNAQIHLLAEDKAGNTALNPLSFHVRNKRFRNDRMNISQRFLEMKMPEFQHRYKELPGGSLLETFSYINTRMREKDRETIESICKHTRPERLWEGVFLRMKNAATMATFGDRRTYYYNGEKISTSVHLGVDLASTQNAPVEASNGGVIAFTGYIGIYGNTVIIDHGMGVFSLYGHLSSIDVRKDQMVKKGAEIGRTGMTGMAGGDHLHFSMIVGGKFVNPVEWWDSRWIRDNVTRKLSGGG